MAVGYMKGHKSTILLSNLNLKLEQGELVALLGKNGAGKSTLLKALTCDTLPIEGTLEINGKKSTEISKRELSRLVALVATERIMGGAFTIRELVSLGRQPHTGFLGRLSSQDMEIVDRCLDAVGITHKANQHVAELSDGERQKAMIAKALAQETPIIMLDEPTAFLDVSSRIETMKLLHTLARDENKAVLLSSHDISQSLLLADQLWVITNDHKLIAGNTEQVVMSGVMDRVFDNSTIMFNGTLCDYEAQLPAKIGVRLDCKDSSLERCVANALLRNGAFVDAQSSIVVKVDDVGHYCLSNGQIASNVKDLVKMLQQVAIN